MNGWPVERSLPIWYNQCKATLSTSTSTLCLWKVTSNSLYVTLWKCPSKSIQTFRWKITLPFSPLPAHCMMVSTRPGSEQNCCSDHSCQWSKLSLFGKALLSWGVFCPGSTQICSLVQLKVGHLPVIYNSASNLHSSITSARGHTFGFYLIVQ